MNRSVASLLLLAGTVAGAVGLGLDANPTWAAQARLTAAGPALAGTTQARTALARPVQAAVPLATSLRTPAGDWATLPMGHLDDPDNRFWQLMFERAGTSSWSDQVEATAVATNGGIVLAARTNLLVVGVRQSNRLTYSPLIATSDSGRTWSTGLVEEGLANVPSALALGPQGGALALDGKGGGEALEMSPGSPPLSSWHLLVSVRSLGTSPAASSCLPTSLTAVGYVGNAPVVGAACARAGVAGLFMDRADRWSLVGPTVPASEGPAEVLGLVPASPGLAALVELRRNSDAGPSLLVAWTTNGTAWQASPYLQAPAGNRLASLGPAGGRGVFALMAGSNGKETLAEAEPSAAQWRSLPAPPAGTQTVTFSSAGRAQALAVDQSVMDVWDLAGTGGWQRGQVVHVQIEYGSSS